MSDDNPKNPAQQQEQPLGSTVEAIAKMDATKFAAYMGPGDPSLLSDGVQLSEVSSSSSSATSSDMKKPKKFLGCIRDPWSRFNMGIQRGITRSVVILAVMAARNPKITISSISVVSVALIAIGFFTNFNLQVDYEKVYAPTWSLAVKNQKWIDHESGFPTNPRPLTFILHNEGKNVLGNDEIGRLFQALDTVRNTPNYKDICSASNYLNEFGEPECKIYGATRFWNHEVTVFLDKVKDDQDAIQALSSATFPGGTPVYTDMVFGHPVWGDGNSTAVVDGKAATLIDNGTMLISAESYFMRIDLPDTPGVENFERSLIPRLAKLKEQWEQYNAELKLTYFTLVAYDVEFTRAINKDLPLVPFMILIMCAFNCLVFARRDRVQSRSMLGLGAVLAVSMSLMTGYGIMFIAGVPFTSMTQILPFVILGVGLDDTFIITGEYFRGDPKKDTVKRIEETMQEIGPSICMTSITTIVAFMLGCTSSIPAIKWVCLYASPTVFLTLVYQVTYFVALVVLDERRVQANRKDICICFHGPNPDDEENVGNGHGLDIEDLESDRENQCEDIPKTVTTEPRVHFSDRFMRWYAIKLMRPWMKLLVVIIFGAYFVFCGYRTTLLTQEFKTQDFVPADSFVTEFMDALAKYSNVVMGIHVYFRNVNQSDPEVQQQMIDYMEDLMKLPAVDGTQPPFCWVMDFKKIQDDPQYEIMKHMEFKSALALALTNPSIREAYGDDIVRDADGEIVASRCWLNPAKLDLDVVEEQVDLLAQQRAVSAAQPVNHGRAMSDLSFFTYDSLYFIWEFYTQAVKELIMTTITGVFAVCALGFILIHHWSASCFLAPLICILYIDMLGTLQYAGLHINAVTYVCMVISIGLLVDFLMHVLLRYYESPGATREAKVILTLETMGVSIMQGGLSTFLGVLPLAFSTSAILRTVFTAFLAMVTLGVLHGLILLPVLLSYLGPTVCIEHNLTSTDGIREADTTEELYESPTKSVQELCRLHTVETESLPSPSRTGSESNSISEDTNQDATTNFSATTGDADGSVTTHDSDELKAKGELNLSNATSETAQAESFSFENDSDLDDAHVPFNSSSGSHNDVVTDFDPFVNAQKAQGIEPLTFTNNSEPQKEKNSVTDYDSFTNAQSMWPSPSTEQCEESDDDGSVKDCLDDSVDEVSYYSC